MSDKEQFTQSIRELDQIVDDLRRAAKDIETFSGIPEYQRIANVMREAADRLDKASQICPFMIEESWHQMNSMSGFNLFRFMLCDGTLEQKVDDHNLIVQKMQNEHAKRKEEKNKRYLERRAQRIAKK